MHHSLSANHLFKRLTGLLERQEVRYLLVGGWNTLFGYGAYAGLLWLCQEWVHYMVVAVIANILSITMAYATHKLLVFQTKGNVLREYVRFYGLYGATAALGLLLLPIAVEGVKISPYVAPLLILGITVVVSYLGHKHFSFK